MQSIQQHTNYTAVALGDNHYGLWSNGKLGGERKGWIDRVGNPVFTKKEQFDKINTTSLSPDAIVKVNRKLYEDAHDNWKSFWSWKQNRNEKRSALEEQFGYDVKHAMHLIRLLRSGIDILEKGVVPVRRDDAQYLLSIREGKFTYDEIVKESEKLSDRVKKLSSTTNLPDNPNYALAKEIMIEIYQKQWGLAPQKTIKNKP